MTDEKRGGFDSATVSNGALSLGQELPEKATFKRPQCDTFFPLSAWLFILSFNLKWHTEKPGLFTTMKQCVNKISIVIWLGITPDVASLHSLYFG